MTPLQSHVTPEELGFLYRAIGLLFLIGISLSIAAGINDSLARASNRHYRRIGNLRRYAQRQAARRNSGSGQ